MRFFLCFIYRGHSPHPPSNHAFSLYLFSYLSFSNHHTLITTLHSVTRKISSPVQSNANQYNRYMLHSVFTQLHGHFSGLVYWSIFLFTFIISRGVLKSLYIYRCKLGVSSKTKQPEVVYIKMVLFFVPPEDVF